MQTSKLILPLLLITLMLFLAPRTPSSAQTDARRGASGISGGAVIFAVAKDPEGTVRMEPIVIISGAKYTEPTAKNEAVAKKFTDAYFRIGRQYRLIFGGGDAGSVTVQKYVADQCLNLVAEASAQTTARLGGEVQALALSSDKIGGGTSSRRAPNETERIAALDLARAVYGQRGVVATLVRKMKTVNLTAIDLERDGKFELVGGFQIDAGNEVKHNLFIIFEPTGAGKYKAAWNWYQKGDEDRRLVDVVDLDGDGTAEVIAEGFEIENNFYVIYKRQAGTWRPVYRGGGGGAC
jgi:hypothetical protein